jgi:hypothetical protein
MLMERVLERQTTLRWVLQQGRRKVMLLVQGLQTSHLRELVPVLQRGLWQEQALQIRMARGQELQIHQTLTVLVRELQTQIGQELQSQIGQVPELQKLMEQVPELQSHQILTVPVPVRVPQKEMVTVQQLQMPEQDFQTVRRRELQKHWYLTRYQMLEPMTLIQTPASYLRWNQTCW